MPSFKNTAGIVALIFIHLIWLIVPLILGFEWLSLSPLLLLLCCFIVGFFHSPIDSRTLAYIGIVYAASFVLSALGVASGRIFGSFFFGQNLGFMVFDTPLVIGVLWLLLSYCASVTASLFTQQSATLNKPIITALLASIMVLVVDVLLEQSASAMDFWYWKNRETPLQNYTAWFVFAFAFNFLFQQLEIDANNKIARWFFVLFVLLLIGLNVFPAYIPAR